MSGDPPVAGGPRAHAAPPAEPAPGPREEAAPARLLAVALPVPVYRLFTYLEPARLAGRVEVGARVRVDFHGRKTVGYVLELPGRSDRSDLADVPRAKLKEIDDLVDERTALPPRSLALLSFVRGRYGVAPGEAARLVAASPLAKPRAANPLVSLAPDWPFRLGRARGVALLIVQYLENRGEAKLSDVARDLDCPPARVAALVARGILAARRPDLALALRRDTPGRPDELTPGQRAAVDAIVAAIGSGLPREFLLHGVTGSGKTEVYLRCMEAALARGRGVLYLVPEIALVPQALTALSAIASDEAAVWHSRMTPAQKREEYAKIVSGAARLVVGTRSAVFLPLADPGLLVIDEEHDGSYRQSGDVGYDAREIARHIASLESAVVVSGSATPSVASYHRATCGDGGPTLLSLPGRVDGRPMPETEVVNLLDERSAHPILSARLADELKGCLEAGGQALLFLNRKGYATVVVCRKCGERVGCPDCDVTLTWHLADRKLRCHLCGHEAPPRATCSACGGTSFRYLGTGTERVVEECRQRFPGATVMRFDATSFKSETEFAEALERVRAGGVDLLVGTQIFSKGHDIRGLSLVGVVSADAAMAIPDHRAAERTFQILAQVTGRAGRDESAGRAIIQTFSPEHYSVRCALTADYAAFFAREIEYRRKFGYPPFARILRLLVTGEEEARVARAAAFVRGRLVALAGEGVRVNPVARAPVYRVARRFRMHVVAFLPAGGEVPEPVARIREETAGAADLRGVALRLEIDPEDLL